MPTTPGRRDAERGGARRAAARGAAAAFTSLLAATGAGAQPVLPSDPFGAPGGLRAPAGGVGLAPSFGGPGLRGPLDWSAGIGTRLTWTDNGLLAPKGQERADTILEVFPFLSVAANGPRAQGLLTYSPRYVMRDLDTRTGDGLTHRLDATGNVFLLDDSIGLQGRAAIADVNTSPLGTSSFDPGLNPSGRSTYKLAEIAPYARGRLGGSQYQVRYGFTWIDDGVRPFEVTQHLLSAQLGHLTAFGPFGWRLYGEQQRTSFGDLLDVDRTFASVIGTYMVSQDLRLGLGANYARSDLVLGDVGENSGWGPIATIEWFPTPRTSLLAGWADTYAGRIAELRATHRGLNWLFGLAYRDTIQDGASAGLIGLDPSLLQAGASGTQATPTLDQVQGAAPPGQVLATPLSYGALNSAVVRLRSLTGTIGYAALRTTYTATAFASEQDNRLNLATNLPGGGVPQDLTQRGVEGRIAQRVTPRATLGVLGRWQRSSSDAVAQTSTLTGVQFDIGYDFTPSTTVGAGYRHVRQRGDGPASLGYDENAVFATVITRF